MKGGWILIISFLWSSLQFPQQKATSEYQKGIESLGDKDTSTALKYFKESIKLHSDAASYFQAGRLELKINAKNNSIYLKTAAELEPGNISYRLAYAKLLEKTDRELAFAEYTRLTSDFPGFVEPLVNIANHFLSKYYSERNALLYKGSNYFVYPEDEVKEYYNSAESGYLRVLEVIPNNVEALAGLASLYFYSDNPGRAIPYLKQITNSGNGFKGAHLMLACIYNMTGHKTESRNELSTAIKLMDSDEREIYTYSSVVELIKPVYQINMQYDLKSEIEAMIKRFWKIFNAPGSSSDEREIEHYLRVAYTNFVFGIPSAGLKGWETERGKVYISFGAPDSVETIRAFKGHPRTQVWHYKDFKLSFSEYHNDGNFYLSNFDQGNKFCVPNSYLLFEEKRNEKICSFIPKDRYTELSSGAFFFGAPDQNDQEIYIGYLLTELPDYKYLKTPLNEYDFTLEIYDNEFDQIVETPVSFSFIRKKFGQLITPGSAGLINFPVPASRGIIVLKGVNKSDSSRCSFHQYFDVTDLSAPGLSVSNIIIASDLETDLYMSGAIKRKRISFIPEKEDDIRPVGNSFLYFEINGLMKGIDGKYEFLEDIRIKRVREKNPDPDLLDFLNKLVNFLFRKDTKYKEINSYFSRESSVQQFYKIDLTGYEPGKYEITVEIEDKVSGTTIEEISYFEVKK